MDIMLSALKKSITHLEIIDEVLSDSEYPEKNIYHDIKKQITELDSATPFNKFSEEFYVGGKKKECGK